jgi:light-regulated signal transduction histidine kinase (bacteriophytochrome)
VGLRLPPGQGVGAQVLRTGRPWRTADYRADTRFRQVSLVGVRTGGHLAMLAVPIQIGGQVEGVLYVSNPTTQPFTDRDEDILVRLAAHAAVAMHNAQLYQQAQAELTERQRAEAALAQAAAELEQRVEERTAALEAANHELEAFSYSVSHDLRAPLRAIQGFARILRDEYASHLPDQAQHYLHLVQGSAQHMGQLIEDLLAFARLSRQPLTTQPVAPADLVRHVLNDLRALQGERRIDFRMGALPRCQADPALLTQVFVNLLANAIKFTSRREVAVIEVGWREEQGEPVYFVKDNGVGFDMAYGDKLFGVFQRLHRTEEYEGTGVGLAIVQRIIHRHGGRIWAEAAVDQGATFYFTLGGG